MTKKRNAFSALTMLSAVILMTFCSGCSEDPPRQTAYNLKVKDVLGVIGTATFTEVSSTIATIDLALSGTPSGTHPAELCMNSAVEGGTVVITLNSVDATGKSSTTVTTKTYSQLIAYDGFIKVMKSNSERNVILVQGDIGGNVITATNRTFTLGPIAAYVVSGNALFEKRVNGNTLVTITLTGTIAGESYPATINLGSIASVGGGPVTKTLSNVDGNIGKSYTNIRSLNSEIKITYDDWLLYDGYINIYQTAVTLGTIICHGDIGSNTTI